MSSKLRATLKRIRENLIHADDATIAMSQQSDIPSPDGRLANAVTDDRRDHVAHPHISPAVNLERTDTLYGLAERVVATESLLV
jgi:syndetin